MSSERAQRERAEQALQRGSADATELLVEIARTATPGGDSWTFAHVQLAELAAERDPWRTALLARRVVARRPEDAHAWALLGLACSLLGHTRAATHAYERALARTPDNPYYAHNLGHLYDVGLDRIEDAIRWLARAVARAPGDPEIAASYAHALARGGRLAEARRVIGHAARRGLAPHHEELRRWIDRGAPRSAAGTPAGTSPTGPPPDGRSAGGEASPRPARRTRSRRGAGDTG